MDGCFTFLLHDAVVPPPEPKEVPQEYEVFRYCNAMNRAADKVYKSEAYKRLKWLQIGEFLQEISQKIGTVEEQLIDFNLFSAHENYIDAIKVAFDYKPTTRSSWAELSSDDINEPVYDVERPPYASRIVIESYYQEESDKIYIRIIYNGNDITKNTGFCDERVVHKEDFIVLKGPDDKDCYLIDFKSFEKVCESNLNAIKKEFQDFSGKS